MAQCLSSRLLSLEKLILEDCTSLIEIHQCIGNLHKLVLLNLQDCKNLKNLPVSICDLISTENLTLSGCSKLDKLLEELEKMWSLKELLADGTAIKQLRTLLHWMFQSLKCLILKGCNLSEGIMPSDFGTLCSMEELDFGYDNFHNLPANIYCLSHIQKLRLRKCRMLKSLPELPSNLEILYVDGCTSLQSFPDLDSLSSLFELDLGYNNFISLPSCIDGLFELVYLTFHYCTRLQSLPELPSSSRNLNLEGCRSMNKLSNLSSLEDLRSLMLRNCDKIVEIQDLEKMESVRSIHLDGCNNLSNAFKQSALQELPKSDALSNFLPGTAIPEWFSHQSLGSSMSFEVPQLIDDKVRKLIVCAIYAAVEEFFGEDNELEDAPFLKINNKTKSIKWRYYPTTCAVPIVPQDHMWVSCIPAIDFGILLVGGDEVEVSIEMEKLIKMKKCGIHLAIEPYEEYSKSDDQAMIQYNSSSKDDFDTNVDVSMLDDRGAKRGRDEMGPCICWSDEEDPKCPTDEGEGREGYSSYFKHFHQGFLKKLYDEGFTKTKNWNKSSHIPYNLQS